MKNEFYLFWGTIGRTRLVDASRFKLERVEAPEEIGWLVCWLVECWC